MVEPSGSPQVATADLLARLAALILRYVVVAHDEVVLLAAWVLHTYAIDAADYTPYVCIQSATKRCGKSRLLEVLELLVLRPLRAANVTPPVLFRSIKPGAEPTMLLDEQDGMRTSRGVNEDMRRIVNVGFRRGEKVLRAGPSEQNFPVQEFQAFCPKAFATIGPLPDTVADRCMFVPMKRRMPGEHIERFRRRDADPLAEVLREEAMRWADAVLPHLTGVSASSPEELDDRGRDIFEPLFVIADDAGGEWPALIRAAAVKNRGLRSEDRDDAGVEVLRDIREKLRDWKRPFIPTGDLIERLVSDSSLRWGQWRRGGLPLNEKGLARLLHAFDIEPTGPTMVDGRQKRGYVIAQFDEAFARYLDDPSTQTGETTPSEPNRPDDDVAPELAEGEEVADGGGGGPSVFFEPRTRDDDDPEPES